MNKKLALLLAAVLCLVPLLPALAVEGRIFDQANLLDAAQEQQITQRIQEFQQSTNMDFVVVISDAAHGNASQQQIADEFYEKGGFGLDDQRSGILYYIDMYDRYHYLSCTGAMQDYMTDGRVSNAIESVGSVLGTGDYARACITMIDTVEKNVKAGIPEGHVRYDVVTGKVLTSRYKALTTTEMLVCAAIALVVAGVFAAGVSASYKLKGSTYDYDYQENFNLKMTDSEDTYLRTTTTQTRKPDPPQNNGGLGGRGGGGFGGGIHTGVHTSSSGTSHSGGGGHF